jgi:hypothetical protein
MAEAYWLDGQPDIGLQFLDPAAQSAKESDQYYFYTEVLRLRSCILAETDNDAAIAKAYEALDFANKLDAPGMAAQKWPCCFLQTLCNSSEKPLSPWMSFIIPILWRK